MKQLSRNYKWNSLGDRPPDTSLSTLEGSYKDVNFCSQDRDDLRQKEKQTHPLKEPDHSRKLSFEKNAIEKSVVVITTGLYSGLVDKAARTSEKN